MITLHFYLFFILLLYSYLYKEGITNYYSCGGGLAPPREAHKGSRGHAWRADPSATPRSVVQSGAGLLGRPGRIHPPLPCGGPAASFSLCFIFWGLGFVVLGVGLCLGFCMLFWMVLLMVLGRLGGVWRLLRSRILMV